MTERPIRIVLSTSSIHAAPLVEAAKEFEQAPAKSISSCEETGTVSMWIAGFKVVVVNAIGSVPPYQDAPDERIVGDVRRIVAEVAHDLATRTDRERALAKAVLDRDMIVRILHERSAFVDDDCRDADVMSMHARTPWGPRRAKMSRRDGKDPRNGLTRSTTLDEWPDEPIVCEVAFDPPVGRGMITISAYRTHVDRPWDIDAMSAMRMISRAENSITDDAG